MAAADDWLCRVDGTVQRSNAANKMAKMRRIKPVVDRICNAISVEERASVLRAAIDHRDLVAAREFIGIDSTKEMSTAKYLCEQSARMLERSRKNNKARGKSSREKRDASEVVLTFTAPSPNRTEDVPSRRNRARLLGIPSSTMARFDGMTIKKRQQLTAGDRGVQWALTKAKKGYRQSAMS